MSERQVKSRSVEIRPRGPKTIFRRKVPPLKARCLVKLCSWKSWRRCVRTTSISMLPMSRTPERAALDEVEGWSTSGGRFQCSRHIGKQIRFGSMDNHAPCGHIPDVSRLTSGTPEDRADSGGNGTTHPLANAGRPFPSTRSERNPRRCNVAVDFICKAISPFLRGNHRGSSIGDSGDLSRPPARSGRSMQSTSVLAGVESVASRP